jgi:asparagine synthase (glutamine-hydrolysing)
VGIAGVAPDLDQALIAAMRDSIAHRGPDAFGSWRSPDRQVVLGHRRSSIVDLSSLGAQPMPCEQGRLAIVFNGEIYKHDSDRCFPDSRVQLFPLPRDTGCRLEPTGGMV